MTTRWWWLWVTVLVGLWARPALAHPTSISSVAVVTQGSAMDVELRLHADSVIDMLEYRTGATVHRANFETEQDALLSYLDGRFEVYGDEQPCPRSKTAPLHYDAGADRVQVRAEYQCPTTPRNLRLESWLFRDSDVPHQIVATVVHQRASARYLFIDGETTARVDLGRMRPADNGAIPFIGGRMATPPSGAFSKTTSKTETGVDNTSTTSILPSAPVSVSSISHSPSTPSDSTTASTGLARDIWLGVIHILGGLDHVLFVLCLLLATTTLRKLAVVITSFTIAHSITLVLGAMGLVVVSPRLVEPVIALSIVWVAIEGIMRKDPQARPAAAFGFGLAHGLGFCSVLMGLGLTGGELGMALVGFNVGVELGQLAVVVTIWPLWIWAQRNHPELAAKGRRVVHVLVALVATLWFFERILA
ncbi:MAG: HupE/UreJ family protein [Myxococcota bacterium]